MTDPRTDLLIPVSRACYEAQWDERFDDLNPAGIEYALALQVGRAAISAMAAVLLAPLEGVHDDAQSRSQEAQKPFPDLRTTEEAG